VRPLRLSVEGFTCFRQAQEVDFSRLDLFAISGPTGAGKSSILDAIIFALYGKVPRLGKKSCVDFISHGADRMSVMFDFELGGKVFRSTRVGYRNKGTQAQLDQTKGGKEQPVASGVQQVNAEVENLLGLRYEAFTQAVILPQGEFAHFLQSTPSDQGEILRDLLRLQVYERMRETAAQKRSELSSECENVRRRLTEDYGDASTELLKTESGRADNLREQEQKIARELKSIEKQFGDLKLKHKQTKDLEAVRESLSKLKKREREISEAGQRLERAKRTAPVVPVIEAAVISERKAAAEKVRLGAAREQELAARESHAAAEKQLERARREADTMPELKERIDRVNEIRGLVGPLKDAQKRVVGLAKQESKLKEDIASAREMSKKSASEASDCKTQLRSVEEDLKKVDYDPQLDRRIEGVRESAMELRGIRKQLRELKAEFNSADAEATKARTKAQVADGALRDAKEKWEVATRTVSKLRVALKEAERLEAALLMRGTLRVGEACPVCDQTVSRLPSRAKASASEAVKDDLDRTEAALKKAEAALTAQRDAELTARNRATAMSTQSASLRQRVQDFTAAVAKAEQRISKIATELEPHSGEPEDCILEAAKRCAKQRDDHDRLKEVTAGLLKGVNRAEQNRDAAEQRAKDLSKQLGTRNEELNKARIETKQLEEKIKNVVGGRDPDEERERLTTALTNIDRALKSAEKAEGDAAAKFARAEQARVETERSATEGEKAAKDARERASKSAREAEFRDEAAVIAAVLPREEFLQVETTITRHKQDMHSCEKTIADVEADLAGKYVSDKALESATLKLGEDRKKHEAAVRELISSEQRIKQLKSKMQVATKLSKELKDKSEALLIYKQLADDLKRDAFQAYLLEDTFAELVKGASVRLKGLSERYTFDYSNKSFFVLDHDNAGARRSADTLSGGETFLASLALALELSEQVQRAAGAVNLDSLFIDEGFGSLDAETLNTVAEAIESLHVGGRMIGIISHIDELTERLPARIHVNKSVEGSKLEIEAN
jgi:exonuclease SbcC